MTVATQTASEILDNLRAKFAVQRAGNLSGLATNSYDPWNLEEDEPYHHHLRKVEMFESDIDLLVLSCARYRIAKGANFSEFNSITDPKLYPLVVQEDVIHAAKIRDHYSKQFMMWALNEVKLTKFREDLRAFILSDGTKFTEATKPMVFRLPEFYKYDMEFDIVRQQMTSMPETEAHTIITSPIGITLRPMKYLTRKLKSGIKHEYWLKDDSTGFAYLIKVEPTNSLRSLWDREFQRPAIKLTGQAIKCSQNGLNYKKIVKWDVAD
jgi:hypothetical protein